MAASKKDDTLSYRESPDSARRRRAAALVKEEHGVVAELTKPGIGVDRVRPPQSIAPGKRTLGRPVSLALVVNDPFDRASLARALVQARCTVSVVESPRDIAGRNDLEGVEVMVVDFDAAEAIDIVAGLHDAVPAIALLALTARRAEVERALAALRFGRFEVLERGGRVPDVLEAVQRLAGA